MSFSIIAITVSALIALPSAQTVSQPEADVGRWNLTVDQKQQGEPRVQLMLFSPGLNTLSLPVGTLVGFPPIDGRSSTGDIEFKLKEDAGTLNFRGSINGAYGMGVFTFAPSAEFGAELMRRGMQRPTAAELFNLARHQVGLSVLDELAANGYETPSTPSFVRAAFSSVDTRFIREMAELGYKLRTLDALMLLQSRGVTPQYVRALARLGYTDLPASTLMSMAMQGIDVEFIRAMNQRASRRLSPLELVRVRVHGSRA